MPANLTEFRDNTGVDVADKWVSFDEANSISSYITEYGNTMLNSGSLYSWGYGNYGALGLGDIVHRSSPTQVGSLTNWSLISSGSYSSYAIKTDGTMWAWGYNDYGALGLGDIVHRSSPTQVGSLTNWKSIGKSLRFWTVAVKTDGTLWAWGQNHHGQLGLGDITHRSSPVQVGSLTDWKYACGGGAQTLAVKTDGTLWAWGFNDYGECGLGNRTKYSSPVQVGALTTWSTVDITYRSSSGIKTDGTMWAWGYNDFGQLGLGNTARYSSPVQVGALTNWKQAVHTGYSKHAVKTDGTLWAFGRNNQGQLGLNSLTDYSSPVQVGTLTNWKTVSASWRENVMAIKTDGTLWGWGNNEYQKLGVGDSASMISSPMQVGALTTWKSVGASNTHTYAILK